MLYNYVSEEHDWKLVNSVVDLFMCTNSIRFRFHCTLLITTKGNGKLFGM